MTNQFHALPSAAPELLAGEGELRTFTGDGTPYLEVPGLQTVLGVYLGTMQMPLTEERTYPKDAHMREFETETIVLFQIATDADGRTFLLRNQVSNDGMWQKGATIHVRGEWSDEPVSEPA